MSKSFSFFSDPNVWTHVQSWASRAAGATRLSASSLESEMIWKEKNIKHNFEQCIKNWMLKPQSFNLSQIKQLRRKYVRMISKPAATVRQLDAILHIESLNQKNIKYTNCYSKSKKVEAFEDNYIASCQLEAALHQCFSSKIFEAVDNVTNIPW